MDSKGLANHPEMGDKGSSEQGRDEMDEGEMMKSLMTMDEAFALAAKARNEAMKLERQGKPDSAAPWWELAKRLRD